MTDALNFEVKPGGAYITTLESSDRSPVGVGVFQANHGRWKTTATVGESNDGTYSLSDANTLLLESRASTTLWKRVSPKAVSGDAPLQSAAPPKAAVVPPAKPVSAEAAAESERWNRFALSHLEADPAWSANDFERAVKLNPQNADALGNLGLAQFKFALRQGGRVTSGMNYISAACRLNRALRQKFERELILEEARDQKKPKLMHAHPPVAPEKMREIAALKDASAACDAGERVFIAGDDRATSLALAYFFRALEIDPLCARARALRGRSFYFGYSIPDVPWAVYNLNAATRLDPNLMEAKRDRGLIQLERMDAEGAYQDFHAALQLKPDSVRLHVQRAIAASVTGRTAAANADKAACRQLDPANADKLVAEIDRSAKNFEATQKALDEDLRRAIEAERESEEYFRIYSAQQADAAGDHFAASSIRSGGPIPLRYSH